MAEEIALLPARQQMIEAQFAESVKEHSDLKAEHDSALISRIRLEADLSSEQQKSEKFRADLMKARNEKEYATAVREIDASKKAISTFETDLIKLMEKIETLDAALKERSPEIEIRRNELDRQLAEIAASVAASQTRLSALQQDRQSMYDTLSMEVRAIYDRVSRLRGGVVLAEAKDYSCQACRMKIRPQVFNDIRRGDTIIPCENCGRVLFFRMSAGV
jgi:predicted  nucleic acid-binding Zn-ribbon protein